MRGDFFGARALQIAQRGIDAAGRIRIRKISCRRKRVVEFQPPIDVLRESILGRPLAIFENQSNGERRHCRKRNPKQSEACGSRQQHDCRDAQRNGRGEQKFAYEEMAQRPAPGRGKEIL